MIDKQRGVDGGSENVKEEPRKNVMRGSTADTDVTRRAPQILTVSSHNSIATFFVKVSVS